MDSLSGNRIRIHTTLSLMEVNSLLVYTINQHNRSLMPCSPRRARMLLKQKKAKCVRRTPFTIKLLYGNSGYVQKLVVAVDSGSKTIGSAVRSEQNKIYYLSEVGLRQDIKNKMDQR